MRKLLWGSFICFAFALFVTTAAFADELPTLDVWPGAVPGETGQLGAEHFLENKPTEKKIVKRLTDVSKPTLTIFRPPKDKDTGAAILICPGGGYSILAWDLEGTEIAEWLNSIGVSGIILKYRVPVRKGIPRFLPPLQDAQRAISLVRSKADEWGIDPKRIGMLGFSAGGNLTAIASTNYDKRAYDPIDDVDKVSCRPDFGVLCYPAWLVKDKTDDLDPEIRVTAQTPPMFFAHAGNDGISCESSIMMFLALRRVHVSAELHVFALGGHGFGMRPATQPAPTEWPPLCEAWMRSQGLLGHK